MTDASTSRSSHRHGARGLPSVRASSSGTSGAAGNGSRSFSGATYGFNPSKLGAINPSTGIPDAVLDVTVVLAGPNTELRVLNSSIDFLREKVGSGPFAFTARTWNVWVVALSPE